MPPKLRCFCLLSEEITKAKGPPSQSHTHAHMHKT